MKYVIAAVIIISLMVILLVLSGCSKEQTVLETDIRQNKEAINMDNTIVECYVHEEYYACRTTAGYTYYVTKEYANKVIAKLTAWDCTTWKEGKCE